MAICVRGKINCHFGVFQRLNWEAASWSPPISACFMSPGITSIFNFEKCNERWRRRIGRSEQTQKFKLDEHFFLHSCCLTSCSSVTLCFQFRKHLGFPSLLNMFQAKKGEKKNIRKRKAAKYAGIKVKQLSSFWNPTLFLISFSCRNRFVFPRLLEVPVMMLGLGGALFSALSALRRLDGCLYLRDHIFPLFHQSAHGWRLHLIGFCYLCNCFNQPITISCERGKNKT